MKLPIKLSKQSREPYYHQIEEQIKALIASGQLIAGTPLPSIRALSKDLEVSVITTRRAFQNLEYEGFIYTAQGKGTFVAEINRGTMQQVQHDTVRKAINKAIETAKQHNYTNDDIKAIVRDVLDGKEDLS
ncbi:GntR family transcriptional regulator [Alkalibacillus haloalkaliphilus]|uniref:GntR family transcriptional regulator n=1 Tax=Alkalibacillus haloalkaliphilus TaxID=94136 RepID=UPI00030010BE|nr:GntR family transcriptional regulator [Alkalibacillus haloalkaliphilus]